MTQGLYIQVWKASISFHVLGPITIYNILGPWIKIKVKRRVGILNLYNIYYYKIFGILYKVQDSSSKF